MAHRAGQSQIKTQNYKFLHYWFPSLAGENVHQGRGEGLVPPPPDGFLAIAPEPFAMKLKFGMNEPHIQAEYYELFSCPGQVRSLTYDVIRTSARKNMPQLRNAAIGRQSFSRR